MVWFYYYILFCFILKQKSVMNVLLLKILAILFYYNIV